MAQHVKLLAAVIGLAVGLAAMAHRRIVGPIRRPTEVAEQVAGGNLAVIADVESEDEIGRLARTINSRLRKEDLQHLMASVTDALWSAEVGADGTLRFRYHSPGVAQIVGLAPERLVALQDWLDLVHEDDRAALQGLYQRVASLQEAHTEIDYRVVHVDTTVRWVRDSVGATRCSDGAVVLHGVRSDITERKRAEQERHEVERQRRQTQRLEAMGTLAGGIAHDFNNILGAILGYGERGLRDAAPGTRLRRDLDSILAAGERGRALVDRILAFSRSGLGEHVAVHVEGVVRETLELMAAKLPADVHIVTELNAGRAAMLGDPTQAHQVLMNLATNAVQAMPDGGTLRVSLHVRRLDGPLVATTGVVGPGEFLVLALADEGVGMSRDIVERIFDPFFTTKDVGVGTGLGLSLVHGIVSDVGGAVDVLSTPGAGSTFTVYLPRSGDAGDDTAPLPGALPRGGRQKVLVVDDEEPLVKLTAENLAELGYLAVPFTSSAAALEAFRAHPERYDAVITDERMPGLSGAALIHLIKDIRPGIPTLLVSGYVGADVLQRARQAGAFDVLKKPLQLCDLARVLGVVLRAPVPVERPPEVA